MVELENGQKCLAIGSGQYVGEAVNNVLAYLKKGGKGLAARASTSMSSGYRPEIDITPKLGEEYVA